MLTLRALTPSDEVPVRRIHDQLAAEDFDFLLYEGTWEEVLRQAARDSAGVDLAPGRVRSDFLVAVVDGEVAGRVSIRYALTDYLLRVGGHVGYAVAPQYRRRGHATEILRQSVIRLADNGVDRVLVTCDDSNIASARTIERCGGVLENVEPDGENAPKRRYWITAPTR